MKTLTRAEYEFLKSDDQVLEQGDEVLVALHARGLIVDGRVEWSEKEDDYITCQDQTAASELAVRCFEAALRAGVIA